MNAHRFPPGGLAARVAVVVILAFATIAARPAAAVDRVEANGPADRVEADAPAISTAAYRARLRSAIVALDAMSPDDEDAGARARDAPFATLHQIVGLLPPHQPVTSTRATEVVVDNTWLPAAIDDYVAKMESDPARADRVRISIIERLRALEQELAATGAPGAASSAEQDKARLAAILHRNEYQSEASSESALMRILRQILKWVAQLFPNANPLTPGQTGLLTRAAEIGVMALAALMLIFAGRKLLPVLRGDRKMIRSRDDVGARVILGERLSAGQTAAVLLAEAEALARKGDLRGAIRKGYIALLRDLSDRRLISVAQYKTNRDYLRDVEDRGPLFREMRFLTDSFERHWYGRISPAADDWDTFRSHYRQALS